MPDREKVIKGMKMCISPVECSPDDCPYYIRPNNESGLCWDRLMTDALALLEEQKEKKGQWIPIESPTGVEAFGVKEMTVMNVRCSVCGSEEDVSFTGYKYCPRCGAKMEGR